MSEERGWKSLPISLKILFVVLVLWVIGSVMAIPARFEMGLPFFGVFVYGLLAGIIVFALDIAAPISFLYALWMRKPGGVPVAYLYMGIFILNSVIVLFTHREELGLMPILIPAMVTAVFLLITYTQRNYFRNSK